MVLPIATPQTGPVKRGPTAGPAQSPGQQPTFDSQSAQPSQGGI